MKLKLAFAAIAAIILTASCGVLGNTNQTSAATANGSAAGGALAALYTQYKTDGKLDLSNLNNIINLATLANSINGLKNQADKSSFVSELISGSKNLVTKKNAATVVDQLATLSGVNLNSITKAASNAANTTGEAAAQAISKINTASNSVSTAVNALESIFNIVK